MLSKKTFLFAILALCTTLLISSFIFRKSSSIEYRIVRGSDLLGHFRSNAVIAWDEWKFAPVRIGARVNGVDVDVDNKTYILVNPVESEEVSFDYIKCILKDPNQAKNVKKGQVVEIKGLVYSYFATIVSISDCEVR